jgi:hypothetical protein
MARILTTAFNASSDSQTRACPRPVIKLNIAMKTDNFFIEDTPSRWFSRAVNKPWDSLNLIAPTIL